MSIDPEPKPKHSILKTALVAVLSSSIFIVGFGVFTFVYRYDEAPAWVHVDEETSDTKTTTTPRSEQPLDSGPGFDAGAIGNRDDVKKDAGPTKLAFDAGVGPNREVDAGSTRGADSGPDPEQREATELARVLVEVEADLAKVLVNCFTIALRRDPGANTKARVRLVPRANGGARVDDVGASASPYFRRCVTGATTRATMRHANWFEANRRGGLRIP